MSSRAPQQPRQQFTYGVAQQQQQTEQQQQQHHHHHQYYYDDGEGYVGDYSESDGLSDSPSPQVQQHAGAAPPPPATAAAAEADFTELYRRKNSEVYHQGVFLRPEYYYEQQQGTTRTIQPPPPLSSVAPAGTMVPQQVYRKRIVVPAQSQPGPRYYAEEQYHHQSLPHVAAVPRSPVVPLQRAPSAATVAAIHRQQQHLQQQQQMQQGSTPPPQMMRRHPVTVRTPRYVRRPIAAVYKRPSALCLPLACQPDPASYRRYKHTVYTHQPLQPQQMEAQKVVRRHSLPTSVSTTTAPPEQPQPSSNTTTSMPVKVAKKSESKKSIDMTKSRLDAILERYEKIFGKNNNSNNNNANDSNRKTEDPNAADQQLLKHLKPRLPPSLKERSIRRTSDSVQSITRQQIPEIMKTAETFEVEEISSDVLDELLSELTENGLNDVINDEDKRRVRQQQQQSQTKGGRRIGSVTSMVRNKISQTELMPEKDAPKSFNYQEIKESISKCYTSESEDGGGGRGRRTTTDVAAIKPIALTEMGGAKNRRNAMMMMANEDVLELHRTKSYVVNLIDTALSNHFGTNISERNPNKNMDPRNAVEMLKKQSCGRMDKDLCLEIAQALTDSFAPGHSASTSTTTSAAAATAVTAAAAAAASSSSSSAVENKGSQCSCKSQLDEPTFVKQLKQMRWGHLKHIQREVRRLEELERFLDSCSVAPLEKYHA